MFSKAEIEAARKMDLLSFMQMNEPDNLVKAGNGSWQLKDHDSLKISNGKWHWFSRDIGGRSALDYLITVRGVSFPQAVDAILKQTAYSSMPRKEYVFRQKPCTLELPEFSQDIQVAKDYLMKRGIDSEVIDWCHSNKILEEDARTHDCVFIGYDGDRPKFAAIRGTSSQVKRDLSGSSKAYSFYIPAESSNSHTLLVFESAIDAMSGATIFKYCDTDHWRDDALLSLSGVGGNPVPIALNGYLSRHREVDVVTLCLDADHAGKEAASRIEEALKDKYVVHISFPKEGKDFNDYLCWMKQRYSNAC